MPRIEGVLHVVVLLICFSSWTAIGMVLEKRKRFSQPVWGIYLVSLSIIPIGLGLMFVNYFLFGDLNRKNPFSWWWFNGLLCVVPAQICILYLAHTLGRGFGKRCWPPSVKDEEKTIGTPGIPVNAIKNASVFATNGSNSEAMEK